MGVDGQAASAAQMATMQALLDTMLDQGAFGLTTGLTYVPSRYAPTEELVSLCETLAKRQHIYASHARDKDLHGTDHRYGPLNEALHLGRTTGARVQYSHAAINTPSEWGNARACGRHASTPRCGTGWTRPSTSTRTTHRVRR